MIKNFYMFDKKQSWEWLLTYISPNPGFSLQGRLINNQWLFIFFHLNSQDQNAAIIWFYSHTQDVCAQDGRYRTVVAGFGSPTYTGKHLHHSITITYNDQSISVFLRLIHYCVLRSSPQLYFFLFFNKTKHLALTYSNHSILNVVKRDFFCLDKNFIIQSNIFLSIHCNLYV